MNNAPIRLALGAEDGLIRQALRLTLANRGIALVAEAATARDLTLLCEAERPDVVVCTDTLDGVNVTGVIEAAAGLGVDVLVLSTDPSVESATACLVAGAVGYVTADVTVDALADAIRAVHAGGAPLDPWTAGPIVREWREMRTRTDGREITGRALSARELEILRLIASGNSTKAIAAKLTLSVKTVENHKTRIFEKLGVRSQAEAVAVGMSRGLLGDQT
jgi:DNA-binding NarL/FixJ family response regulator